MRNNLAAVLAATALASAAGTAVAQSPLTTDPPNNGSGGVWMDLTPTNTSLAVTQFDIAFTGTVGTFVDVEVWVRSGSYVGFTDGPTGWTHTQTISVERLGTTTWSPMVLTDEILLPGGETTAVYLQALESGGIRYTGTAADPPQTNWMNADLALYSEHATTAASAFGPTVFTPRTFSGAIHYEAAALCVGDLTGNGSVGVSDLLELLAAWGPCPGAPEPSGECADHCGGSAPSGCFCDEACIDLGDCCPDVCDGCFDLSYCGGPPIPPCPADLTDNGSVGVADLLELLANWGPCPQPTGACCTGESCSEQTEEDCLNMNGVYKGNSVACDPNPCLICGPLAGDCCEENPTPGCNDEDCCNLICGQDPFCCDDFWDEVCATLANDQCAACICELAPGDADYQYDNGTINSAITWSTGGVVAWAQRYDRDSTGLVLTNVATTFGLVGGTSAVNPGDPVGIAVLQDTGSGPGASIWWDNSFTADAAAINTGVLQKFDVPNVNLPESFYLVAWVQVPAPPNAHPGPGDTGSLAADCPQGIGFFADDVWLMGAAGSMDFFAYDPDVNVSGPLNMHGAGFPWVFLLRGNEP